MEIDRNPLGMHDSGNFTASNTTHRSRPKPKKRNPLAAYEHIPIGIVEASPAGNYVGFNEEFCRILGYERQELLQCSIQDVTHKDDYPIEADLLKQLLAGEISFYKLKKRYVHKQGRSVWVELTRSVVRNARGEPLYSVGAVLDITERQLAEKTSAEFARQQESLYNLADQLNRAATLEEVYNAALDAILGALLCDRASVLLFDEANVMRFVAWRGLSEQYRQATDGHSPWNGDEKEPAPICMNDVSAADLSDSLRAAIQHEGIGSLAFIPVMSNGILIGKLMMYFNTPHHFSDDEVELSLTIARQLAFGIQRKHVEEALRESEARFRAILNQATAGIVRKKLDGTLTFVNQAFCSMLDYTDAELVGRTIWQFTHPDDLEENKRLYDRLMLDGLPFQLEKRLIRRDGSTLWVNASVSPVMNAEGRPQSAVAVEVDITGRKQAEEALYQLNLQLENRVETRTAQLKVANQALKENRRRLVVVQEEERRALARELHDRVGQSLTALNVNLTIIRDRLSDQLLDQVGNRLDDSMTLLEEVIPAVRDVMSNLRPAVLDDYGLEVALRTNIKEFTSRFGIVVDFATPPSPIQRLDSSIEMTLLRIAQEALLNIAKHAHTRRASILLEQEGSTICMTVADDGVGMKSGQPADRRGSHGLTIMRERAEAVSGSLDIVSTPGMGTKIVVSIPVQHAGSNKGHAEREL